MTEPVLYNREFTVPIEKEREGRIFVLWPCDGAALHRFVKERFDLDPGDRNAWDGKCYSSQELDERVGQPAVAMAFQSWELNLTDPQHWETNSHQLSLLAHECFHAAEWMLKQTGKVAPVIKPGEQWEAWEDAAYLLQRIMRRALESMLQD
jgi:hypothetical protein